MQPCKGMHARLMSHEVCLSCSQGADRARRRPPGRPEAFEASSVHHKARQAARDQSRPCATQIQSCIAHRRQDQAGIQDGAATAALLGPGCRCVRCFTLPSAKNDPMRYVILHWKLSNVIRTPVVAMNPACRESGRLCRYELAWFTSAIMLKSYLDALF